MLVNVIGLGYIGLPTSLMLAAKGSKVVGSDLNESAISQLNNGNVTFEEDGLQTLYSDALKNGISFTSDYSPDADIYIVTVPTPFNSESKKIDPKYLISATERIISTSIKGGIIVIESTVSPGTINKYIRPLITKSRQSFDLVHAPERILPGSMIKELINNPRTIGADNPSIALEIKKLYESFCTAEIALTTIEVAEMSKVVENTFRDINIAFSNELAQICEVAGLDVYDVIEISNKHPRVNILSPGPGVGGHCISVDPWFLVGDYPDNTALIQTARKVNDGMPEYILEKLENMMGSLGLTDYSNVGVYGITYKENVDDIRESPTLQFIDKLVDDQKQIRFFDSHVKTKVCSNQYDDFNAFIEDLELMVVFVNHSHLHSVDLPKELNIFDTRNTGIDHDRLVKL